MKQLSLIVCALLISMSSMAQMYLWQGGHYTAANLDSITFSLYPGTDNLPQVAPTQGKYTIVWNAVGYTECNDLVFAGNYNNYNITNVAAMAKFEKIAGYTNWYKAVITPTETIKQLEGKPCALASDGTFPTQWDYQWIGTEEKPCEVIMGDVEFLEDYTDETRMIVKKIGSVVYVRSYSFKRDPCVVEPVYDVTFNLTTAQTMPADANIYVVGDFKENAWEPDAYPMTRIDNTHFTATIKSKMGREYKYVVNGSWNYEMMDFPEEGNTCSYVPANMTISSQTMTDYVYGFRNINATYCGDNGSDILDNFAFSDYGLFGTPELIEGANQKYITVNGNQALCQGGYIQFAAWDNGLTYTNGKGFSGKGLMILTDMPVWVVLEGTYKGNFIEPDNGCYWIDTCNTSITAYTAKAGELVNLQNYGGFFKQVIAKEAGIIDNVDVNLYYSSQTGTQIFQYNADEGSQTYNLGNIKEAGFKKDNGKLLYYSIIEWYDFIHTDRWFGLKANLDADGNLLSLVEPYDMRTIQKVYTNIETNNSAPAKTQSKFRMLQAEEDNEPQYTLADPAHIHLGENPFPADVKRVMKK